MSSTVNRVSLIEERFAQPQVRDISWSTTAVHWLSIAVLFNSAWYSYGGLKNSCSTFRFLDTTSLPSAGGLFRNIFSQPRPTCLSNNSQSFIRKLFCIFPQALPVSLVRAILPDFHPYNPTCSTEELLKQNINSTWLRVNGWILLPFLIKVAVAYFGLLHELFLFTVGRASTSSKSWVFKLLRHSLLGWTTASSCLVVIALTIDPSESILLSLLLQVSCFAAVALSTVLFFRRIPLIRFVPATIHAVKVSIVLARGTVVAHGSDLTFLLVAEGLLEICAVLVSVDNFVVDPPSSALYNILTTLSMLALYAAIVLVGNAKPGFPDDYSNVFFPPECLGTIAVVCIASGTIGFIVIMLISPKTYQAFRTTCSGILWSFLQLLLLSASFVKNPYKLSKVYDKEHLPVRLTLKPFWQQHPLYMAKRLDLPTIASDELPRTIEIFKDFKSALKGGFGLLCWLDYHFPQADPLAPLKNKVRMRPWDDGTRFYPSLLFHLSPTFPKEAKSLQETPEPMIDAFKEGSLLAYLCQYGVGNTSLRRAREINIYPFFERIGWDDDHIHDEGVVLDFRYLEPYETKPDYEPYGGVAYFKFEEEGGVGQLVVKWVVTPRTKRKTAFNKYCGDFRRAEEMIISSLYFETAVGKHLGELHMTYNVLSTIMINAFDCGLNTNFPSTTYNAHPFRLILYPHLYSHNIVVELTVNHLVQVGGYFTQVFALTQESLCDYLTINFSLFHYAEDERFEQRIRMNRPILSSRHLTPPTAGADAGAPAVVGLQPQVPGNQNEAQPAALNEAEASQVAPPGNEDEAQPAAPVADEPPPPIQRRLPSFNCCLDWELDYRNIFVEYASEMMDAIYGEDVTLADAAVGSDQALQDFYQGLLELIHIVPERYHEFKTKAGVARFISDTIFHLTVKHEFYGNTGFFAAVDPRINATQVPKDGEPPAVDEWLSLAFIFIGTAHPHFICLLQDAENTQKKKYERVLESIFEDATPIRVINTGSEDYTVLRKKMKTAFGNMQLSLRELHKKWKWDGQGNRATADENYMYFRPLPADLPTGPGY